ncbi:MAG: APC family permease [candidate division Zixibacteria bacterium]|nr:APC family permease [candidate division Zixibacteria bacterium]
MADKISKISARQTILSEHLFFMTTEQPDISLPPDDEPKEGFLRKLRHLLFGLPRNISEPSIFHRLSLIPILAWIGLGADGLSSSSYGPEEAFRVLGGHAYLAIALGLATALTIFIISFGYSRMIEEFPSGGGGYVVASKLLGERLGVLSGCALLVDYVLTIAVSITAAGDNMFSVFPIEWQFAKLPIVIVLIIGLTILNIRGVRESILALAPIFFLFVATHVILIGVGILTHVTHITEITQTAVSGFKQDYGVIGFVGILLIFVRAYSMGGGTYTGLETVSNSMPVMREPRVHTAKRTMLYMAVSLSITASGLILCYLLWEIVPEAGKTMNASLAEHVTGGFPFARIFVILTLFSAGALLVVAAQAGLIAGPRVLANMAVDSWVPRHFATLSERLTTMNGIVLMGIASLAVVIYTRGNIHMLILMYSINVFLTFSLSMFAMLRLWWSRRGKKLWKRRVALFSIGFLLCLTVLCITIMEKFTEGGWLTAVTTLLLVVFCFGIRKHYQNVTLRLTRLDDILVDIPFDKTPVPPKEVNPKESTAAVLVGGYGGLGIHTLLAIFRSFPKHFKNVIFISVGVVDSGEMKGVEQLELLKEKTEDSLKKYVRLADQLGFPADYRMSLGPDVVEEGVKLCFEAAKEFPHITFFAGQLVFKHEAWYHRLLHNQTAFSIQRQLFWEGQTMIVLPVRVR